MKKISKLLAYITGIAVITAIGSIFGSTWGAVTFFISFLSGASVFVMTDDIKMFSRKRKKDRFCEQTKDNQTHDMKEILGEFKGIYLSNAKKNEQTPSNDEQSEASTKSGPKPTNNSTLQDKNEDDENLHL